MIYAAFVLKIRVLSFNKWHGLDHRNPYVMWPLEKPWEKNKRFKGILSSLKDYRHELNDEVLDIWCFQELNPIKKEARAIAKQSGYEHKICAVNRGVEVGLLHAPWTLSEGLGIFYPKSADVLNYRWELLSGKAWDFSLKYKKWSFPLFFQKDEIRCAQFLTLNWNSQKVLVVNLHLHAKPDSEGGQSRRLDEVAYLLELIEDEEFDVAVLAGDFNSTPNSAVLDLFRKAGFVGGENSDMNSYAPSRNSVSQRVAQLESESMPDCTELFEDRRLDYILVKNGAPEKIQIEEKLVFDESTPSLSDHYAMSAELQFANL